MDDMLKICKCVFWLSLSVFFIISTFCIVLMTLNLGESINTDMIISKNNDAHNVCVVKNVGGIF